MKFGFAVPAYGEGVDGGIAELVDAGEELGFDSAWWPDHIAVPDYAAAVNLRRRSSNRSPRARGEWVRTTRLRFGTDVLVAPVPPPARGGRDDGTMGALAGDRLVLGVGIGYLRGEFDVLGADYDARAATTEEWIRALREPPEGFSVVQAPTPVPVWVGGNNPRALAPCRAPGDGWHPLWLPPEEYATARERDPRHPADAGLDAPFTFSFSAGPTRFADVPRAGGRRHPPVRPRAPSSATRPSLGRARRPSPPRRHHPTN